jgi:DNA-binding NtrC family response regulator
MKTSILYLDDEPEVLAVFLDMFGCEYDVTTAATAADARRALSERPADIVISDQAMPDILGTEFLAEVARAHPQTFRVMLTGSITVGGALPEIGSGVVHLFAAKPWDAAGMRRLLDRAALHFEMNTPE